jgi:archaellum component FlaC
MRLLINRGINEKVKNLLKELKDLFTEFEHVSVDISDLDFKTTSILSPY